MKSLRHHAALTSDYQQKHTHTSTLHTCIRPHTCLRFPALEMCVHIVSPNPQRFPLLLSVARYFICVRHSLEAVSLRADPCKSLGLHPTSPAGSLTPTFLHTHSLRSIPILTALPLFVYSRERRPEVPGGQGPLLPNNARGPRGPQMPPFKNPSCSHRLEPTTPDTIVRDQPSHDLGARGAYPRSARQQTPLTRLQVLVKAAIRLSPVRAAGGGGADVGAGEDRR